MYMNEIRIYYMYMYMYTLNVHHVHVCIKWMQLHVHVLHVHVLHVHCTCIIMYTLCYREAVLLLMWCGLQPVDI